MAMAPKIEPRHVAKIKEWIANLGPSTTAARYVDALPNTYAMELLVAYRMGSESAGWILCRYEREEQEQAAFNAVANAVPPSLELEVLGWRPGSRLDWVCIPSLPASNDPLGQYGYMGAKWK
jgi:hypothetical protein